jgi:hypothetical protein
MSARDLIIRASMPEAPERGAHRAAYAAFRGDIPPGRKVLHRCDTPLCVNPDHLWLGSNTDNMRDMAEKGRTGVKTGEGNPMSKMTRASVEELRGRPRFDGCISQWSREHGVSRRAIAFALRGDTWK